MLTNAGTIAQAFPSQPVERFSYHHNNNVGFENSLLLNGRSQQPYVEILEQPVSIGARFRYKCEGRSAGCIRGINSTDKLKTYPTIKVYGYQGAAGVVVSCVTKDGPPFYPHPHNLVGKTCSNGVCYKPINTPDMICNFMNLGIQCVKKKDIKESLSHREAIQVDPFGTGFSHHSEPSKINLNALRLCFQVFLPDENGKLSIPLTPVITNPIFDNKTVSDLTITKLSHYSAPVTGGLDMILLCDQVNKDDIQILFYEESDNCVTWCAHARFEPHHVHRKAAISFQTPPYKTLNMSQPVECFIQLRRPSDAAVGKAVNFSFTPLKHDPEGIARKRQKFENLNLERILKASNMCLGDENGTIITPRTIKQAVRTKGNYHSSSHCPLQDLLSSAHTTHQACSSLMESSHVSIANAESGLLIHNNDQASPSQNSAQILAISNKKINTAFGEENETLDRLSSLDLGIDPNDLDVNLSGINLDTFSSSGLNFSHSLLEAKSSLERT